MIQVSYHSNFGRKARPAINVKCPAAGLDFWPDAFGAYGTRVGTPGTNDPDRYSKIVELAYESTIEAFWQDAATLAEEYGLGPIEQEGRSGGWLVFTSGYDPEDDYDYDPDDDSALANAAEKRIAWLAAYRSMVEWCESYIADAPRKVAALAQQLAMDEAGEEPAHRMFATFRRELTLREFRAIDGAAYYAEP